MILEKEESLVTVNPSLKNVKKISSLQFVYGLVQSFRKVFKISWPSRIHQLDK